MCIQHAVKGLNFADAGREAIEWADRQMSVDGITIAACLHIITETALVPLSR